ncbi:hypothetical protein [uncultured Croceitalea sp.]|uniref:hypothetical protein n=1 Tax=uncultured Croceitalea sp. TaxID=1798908 RepID=UPI0033057372
MKSIGSFLVILFLILSCSSSDSSGGEESMVVVPTVTTNAVSNITINSAISGGNISSNGGGSIIRKGVCWSITENPTIADNRTQEDTLDAIFTSNVESLNPGTTYFLRAYASNSAGVAYGAQITFTTLQ